MADRSENNKDLLSFEGQKGESMAEQYTPR